MQYKGQTAIEFLSTYNFTFLIIAIVLLLLIFFASLPKSTLPLNCGFYSGFSCADNFYFNSNVTFQGSTVHGSQFVIIATDGVPGIINITNFSVYINNIRSFSGYCTPSIAKQGETVYCAANFTALSTLGNIYSAMFTIYSNYCAASGQDVSSPFCPGSGIYTYAGSARLQGTSYVNAMPQQYIYCVGGKTVLLNSLYYAPIGANGIGAWRTGPTFPSKEQYNNCLDYNNNIYCVGTSSGGNAYYSPLSYNGVPGNWVATTSYPVALSNGGCSEYNGNLYCVGDTTQNAYMASVSQTSGGIGQWAETTSYPIQADYASCSIYDGIMYCIGSNTGNKNQSYYAPITGNGIGAWQQTTPYPVSLGSQGGCTAYFGTIYCVGGGTGNSVYYAPASASGIGQWHAANSFPVSPAGAACVAYGGVLYCQAKNRNMYSAQLLQNGMGPWITGNTYPTFLASPPSCVVPLYSGGFMGGGGGPV